MQNYNPKNEIYWDVSDLTHEMERIVNICNGCRLCDGLCPTFNVLFDRIDEIDDRINKGAEESNQQLKNPLDELNSEDYDRIVNLCYHCKLCYPKCPYVPPHSYMLDFPRLMMRWHLVSAKRNGVSLTSKLLGNPNFIGKIGSTVPDLMNWMNVNRANRILMELTVGIHRERNLPKYQKETFSDWFKKHRNKKSSTAVNYNGKVALFYTCSVEYNDVEIGKAVVKVLEKNNIEVICPTQICCGLPHIDGGDFESAVKKVNTNIKYLKEAIELGYDVVIIQPSCSLFIKQEYKELGDDGESAEFVSKNSYDVFEYLMKLHKNKILNTDFKTLPMKILYHLPCHLKAQNIGLKTRDVLKMIPGVEIEIMQNCSGHDGTWSMKKENYELSLDVGEKLFKRINNKPEAIVVSDCTLSHLQIEAGTQRKAIHPIMILKDAYGIN